MNKQKLISVLQSRIAKRRNRLAQGWEIIQELSPKEFSVWIDTLINVGLEQKEDKQILKQLVEDERSIKEWKARFWKTLGMYCKEGL